MTESPPLQHLDWERLRLIAFDVDGTLYNQRSIRIHMARELFMSALTSLDAGLISTVSTYRQVRERLGEQEVCNFEETAIAKTAAQVRRPQAEVRKIIAEWIETRPLPYLAAARYRGLLELFGGLKRQGKIIGILSDYPAHLKLGALGLSADLVISACDENVQFLKPNPRGLEVLMDAAGVTADETLLIGDRTDRDGLAARRAGTKILIRSPKPIDGWLTFAQYTDPLFAPILTAVSA